MGIQKAKGDKNGGVNCNVILEHHDDDLLDEVGKFGGRAGRSVVGFGVLDVGTKKRAVRGILGILGAGRSKVLEFVQGFLNVVQHGDIAGAASVIPGKGESTG